MTCFVFKEANRAESNKECQSCVSKIVKAAVWQVEKKLKEFRRELQQLTNTSCLEL
jgi:hypothetical protein